MIDELTAAEEKYNDLERRLSLSRKFIPTRKNTTG